MPLFDNESRILQIETEKTEIFRHMEVRMQSKGIPCHWKKRLR